MTKSLRIKPLNKQQIIISIDRLTRFKPTEEKYLRVFKEVILSNLIYPKFKKNELNLMNYEELTQLAQEVFNFSLGGVPDELTINKKLFEYEKSVFKFNENIEILLNNKINYESAIKLFDDKNIPLNLKWLQTLGGGPQNNKSAGLRFPVKKVILTEGITEEILLPTFAHTYGYDFDKNGIVLISAGGKNQVVKLFYRYADILKLPIFVLLDNDAKDNYEEIKLKLRKTDKVHILKNGEFEDLLPLNLMKRTLNNHFKNYFSVSLEDLRKNGPMTKVLTELFKSHGLEFKKAEFANLINENITDKKDLSEEITIIISEIM